MKIAAKFKKLISTLVCVMMVAGTFPMHMLNASVFAEDVAFEEVTSLQIKDKSSMTLIICGDQSFTLSAPEYIAEFA